MNHLKSANGQFSVAQVLFGIGCGAIVTDEITQCVHSVYSVYTVIRCTALLDCSLETVRKHFSRYTQESSISS